MTQRAPTILLIDDDDADRMTLGRMLKESGYRVMAVNRGADALHTFVIHHLHIALVLARTRLPDFTIPEFCDALFRIDRHVPIVMAGSYAYSENGLDEASRRGAFAETLSEVRRRLQGATRAESYSTPADSYFRSSAHSSIRFNRQAGGENLDVITDVGDDPRYRLPRDLRDRRAQHERRDRRDALASAGRLDLLKIKSSDPRSSLERWERARRRQLRRVGRIGVVAAAICTVLVTALLALRTTPARAIEQEEARVTAPLSSSAISGRVGIIHLVPGTRVKSSNFADDLTPRLRQTSRQPSRRPRR